MRSPLACLAGLVLMVLLPAVTTAQTGPGSEPERRPDVRVTLANGTRLTGKLVSLTPAELVVMPRQATSETRYTLADVRRVETVHHGTRNLALLGAAVGFGIAMAGDWCGGGQPFGSPGDARCFTAKPALIVAAGVAIGAAVGHGLDRNRRKVLFAGPTVQRKGVSVGVIVGW